MSARGKALDDALRVFGDAIVLRDPAANMKLAKARSRGSGPFQKR